MEQGVIDNASSNCSLFEKLPTELVWNIIDFVPESVFDLSLTSPIIRQQVYVYAFEHRTFPVVQTVSMDGSSFLETSVYVPITTSKLFELRLKLCKFPTKRITRREDSDDRFRYHVYRINIDVNTDDEQVPEQLGRCIGRTIDKLWLYNCVDRRMHLATISKIIEGIHIDKLSMGKGKCGFLSEDMADHLLQTIESGSVRHLALSLQRISTPVPVTTLLQLSSLVPSLYLHQMLVQEVDHTSNFFLGIRNADWPQIITEMLTRKLDTLCLINTCFPEYISSADAEALRKMLPSLGRKIFFRARTDAYLANGTDFELKYTINDHSVHGIFDADWAPSIIEMLYRKLGNLHLMNTQYSGFLTKAEAGSFIELD